MSFYRFKGESDVFTWLASIAKHTYYRYLRKNKHHLETISTETLMDFYEQETAEYPEEVIERRFLLEAARKALLSLPKKYQDVTILRVYAEMSYAQIGDALHISENSARVIYFRAKKMMTEAIAHEHEL